MILDLAPSVLYTSAANKIFLYNKTPSSVKKGNALLSKCEKSGNIYIIKYSSCIYDVVAKTK